MMVNEFGNCITDSRDGGFGHEEGTGPSSVLDKEAGKDDDDDDDDDDNGSDDSDSDNKEDSKEDLEKELDGDKTQEKGVIHEDR